MFKSSFSQLFHRSVKIQLCVISALLLFFAPLVVDAATYTWDGGGGDTYWTTCANWSSDTCPLTTDSVVFSASSTKNADIAANTTIVSLSINSGYTGTITATTSTVSLTGAFSQSAGTFVASAATTTFGGNFTFSGGTFSQTSGTAYFAVPGNGTLVINSGSAVFNNVFFNMTSAGTANFYLGSDMVVNGSMYVQNTTASVLTLQSNSSGSPRAISVGGDLVFPSTAAAGSLVFSGSAGTFALNVDLKGNLNLADSGVTMYGALTFSSSSNQTITKTDGTISGLSNWYDTGAGGLALAADFSGSMVLNTDSIDDFSFANTSYTFTVGGAVVGAGTSFAPSGPSTYIFSALNLNTTGTFNSSASTSIGAFTQSNGTFNATNLGTTTFTGNFSISGGTFNANNGTVYFAVPGSATRTISPGSTAFNNVLFGISSAGTANFYLGSDMVVNGSMYVQNTTASVLTLQSNSSGSPRAISVGGDLVFPSTAAAGSLVFSGSAGTFALNVDLKGNLNLADSGVTMYGALTFSSSSNQTITKTDGTISGLSNFLINKTSGSVVLASAFASGGTITVATGTLQTAGFGLTGSSISVGAAGNLQIRGSETITAPTFAAGATMTYDGTVGPYTLKNYTYKNLTIQGSGATFNLPAALDINGSLTIAAGTLDVTASNYALNVERDWSNSGTFTPRSGTVFFDGVNQTIAGTNTFYNLTKASSTAATWTFPAGATQTITNTWTASGTAGNLLSLRSSSSGSQWRINPQASRSLAYLDVKDSNNTNASAISQNVTFTNSGNNSNWGFDTTAPFIFNVASTTSSTTATITWNTDEAATSTVDYGLTTGYGTTATSLGTSSHSVLISGLTQNTTYHYRINANDALLNATNTLNLTFTTLDVAPPVIASVATSTTQTTATITWTTDEAATSTINYGLNSSYGTASSSVVSTTTHRFVLTGLTPETVYHFQISSWDTVSNLSTSSNVTFTTLDATTLAPTLVSPTTGTYTNTSPMSVSFMLPEVMFANSLTFTLTPSSGTPIVIHLNDTTPNVTHSFNLPLTGGISAVTEVSSTNSDTVPVGTHTVTLSYQDALGNPATTASVIGVVVQAPVASVAQTNIGATAVSGTSVVPAWLFANNTTVVQTQNPAQAKNAIGVYAFDRNFGLNMVHTEVKNLQRFLNTHGFSVATTGAGSPGKETTKFGPATRAALIRFQKANKISPASGFFGPITRAVIAGMR